MKQISLDGRLGRDAEVKITSGGTKYVKFTLANTVYEHGEEKTEWFDVTSYDPFVIEKQIKVLTKGTYIILNGGLKTECKITNGKVYINQYVTANNIDAPKIGTTRREETSNTVAPSTEEPVISTYTKPTEPNLTVKNEEPVYEAPNNNENNDGDDLPF